MIFRFGESEAERRKREDQFQQELKQLSERQRSISFDIMIFNFFFLTL